MEDRGKLINFGDLMYAVMWAGKAWAHVKPRGVSRSPVGFEEDLGKLVSTSTMKPPRRRTRYK